MFAQCPTCRTVYQVSAADLNVNRGRIHCDFCDTTFDALGALTDHPLASATGTSQSIELEPPEDAADAATHAPADDPEPDDDFAGVAPSGVAEPEHETADRSTAATDVAARAEQSPAPEEIMIPPAAADGIATEHVAAEPMVDANADAETSTGDVPESAIATVPPEAADVRAALAPVPIAPAPLAVTPLADAPLADASPADAPVVADVAQAVAAIQAPPEVTHETEPEALDPDTLRGVRRSPWSRASWSVAAVILLLVLGAQIVHRMRSELILQPAIAPWMYRIYNALGIPLDPNWDVERYHIVRRAQMSTVASPDGATRLRLVATLTNDATRPQPYPLLRLTLEDRWGSAVGARDFAPREYLRDNVRAASLLAPGEQADVELLVVDPGADAAGFRLDLCLADVRGVTRCADDKS